MCKKVYFKLIYTYFNFLSISRAFGLGLDILGEAQALTSIYKTCSGQA